MGDVVNVKIIEEANILFDILPYVISVLCAVIAGLASWIVAHKQAENSIKELDQKYRLEFEQYKKQDLYEMRKKVIFKALTLFDDYISWLTVEGVKPTRKEDCSNSKFTFKTREVYNELCVTVENQKLVELFNQIFFGNTPYFLDKVAEFRKEARKELGLSNIEFPKGAAFISKISTDDLTEKEAQQKVNSNIAPNKLQLKNLRLKMKIKSSKH